MQFDRERIRKYLINAKACIFEMYGRCADELEAKGFEDAIEIGISNTIAALYDADIQDNIIYNLLNKYWGLDEEEAQDRLKFEKAQITIIELKQYLNQQGKTEQEIRQFIIQHRAQIKIRHTPELWELRHTPEELIKAIIAN